MKKYLTLALALVSVASCLSFAQPAEAKHHGWGNCHNNWNRGRGWGRGGCRGNKHWGKRWGNNWGNNGRGRGRGCGSYRSSGLGNLFGYY